ncbi:hypothetical protein G4B88_028024 [Cannabis sativa]|uniref:CCHC-type domain-containing protein n=1 Tax=Cannabis sativa TaxID=3483 RepID=A0A7J6I6R9_CANSA|nr:hypothetical protein G4B88_028024 [Cannabis sativa]
MAQHNPISAMLHQPDEEFDSQSSSSSSDQEENSEESSETWSQDSDTTSLQRNFQATLSIKEKPNGCYNWRNFQLVLKALEKMCSQKKFLQEFMKQSKKLGKVCSRRDLLIKCPSESSCSCKTPKKKTKFKTFKFSKHKGRKIKFLRKKRDFRKKSDRCFVCGKKGHYAKQCPKGKTVKLISHIQQTTGMSLKENDIESIFSTNDEFNSESLCAFEQWSDSDTPE